MLHLRLAQVEQFKASALKVLLWTGLSGPYVEYTQRLCSVDQTDGIGEGKVGTASGPGYVQYAPVRPRMAV